MNKKQAEQNAADEWEQLRDGIQADPESLAYLIASLPPESEELGQLLNLSVALTTDMRPNDPDQAFIDNARLRLLNRMKGAQSQSAHPKKSKGRLKLRPAFGAIAALLCALFVGGFSIAYAAGGSLPGDRLYDVKLGTEELRLALSWSEADDMALLGEFADERLQEMEQLLAQDQLMEMDQALDAYADLMDELTQRAELGKPDEGPGSSTFVIHELSKHIAVLERVRDEAPSQAQDALEKAIERSQHSQSVMEQLDAGLSPSDLAPGQEKKNESSEDATHPGQGNKPEKPHRTKTPGPPKDKDDSSEPES